MSLSRSAAQFFKNKAANLTNTVTSAVTAAASSSISAASELLSRSNRAASGSLAYARSGLTRTQAQLARLSPFALLAFAQEVAGYTEQVYVHDESTYPPTDYRFTYESSDFPDLRTEIVQHISTATIEGFPATAFAHHSTPACTYSSAKIELSIEAGRAMSRFFSDGLDAAMSHMCPDPYDSTTRPLTQAEIIAICCIAGLAVVGVCVVAGCLTRRTVNNSDLRVPLNPPPSPDVFIQVHDNHDHSHHHDHGHHHDHSHHHHHGHSTSYSNVMRLP